MSARPHSDDDVDQSLRAAVSRLLMQLEQARRERDRALKERDQLQRTIDHYRQRLARERALNIRLAGAIGRKRKSIKSPSDQCQLF